MYFLMRKGTNDFSPMKNQNFKYLYITNYGILRKQNTWTSYLKYWSAEISSPAEVAFVVLPEGLTSTHVSKLDQSPHTDQGKTDWNDMAR